MLFFFVFGKTAVYKYVDTGINDKISGTCTDYLVFFGIASINLTVIVEYAVPLAILCAAGIICVILTVMPLGHIFVKDSWFEHAIFCFGYLTGVFAIGFVLLRIVDPENRSKTLEDSAMTPLSGFLEIAYWSSFPALLAAGKGWWIVGINLAAFIALCVAAKVLGMWHKEPLAERRFYGIDAD